VGINKILNFLKDDRNSLSSVETSAALSQFFSKALQSRQGKRSVAAYFILLCWFLACLFVCLLLTLTIHLCPAAPTAPTAPTRSRFRINEDCWHSGLLSMQEGFGDQPCFVEVAQSVENRSASIPSSIFSVLCNHPQTH